MRGLLASPLGFLIGLSLGALGGGGSILAVPALVYVAGQDPRQATATSLLVVGAAAAVGLVPHWRARRAHLGIGGLFGATGIVGSFAGSALNHRADPDALMLGFSFLVFLAAWRMRTGCPTCTRVGEQRAVAGGGVALATRADLAHGVAIAAAGIGVGFLTGLFGVGGGFVIVPALTLLLKLPMPDAIGTSLVVVVINSAGALVARAATTTIDWRVAIPFAASALVGVLTGSRVAGRLDPARSLRWFTWLLVAIGAATAIDAVIG